jgi:hypothetical protein
MPSQDVLITVGTDLLLKVWNKKTEKMTHSFKTDKQLVQIQYCKRNEMIAYMDVECSIGVIPLSLESVCVEPMQDVEECDDIDIVDLDDAMSAEEEEKSIA